MLENVSSLRLIVKKFLEQLLYPHPHFTERMIKAHKRFSIMGLSNMLTYARNKKVTWLAAIKAYSFIVSCFQLTKGSGQATTVV